MTHKTTIASTSGSKETLLLRTNTNPWTNKEIVFRDSKKQAVSISYAHSPGEKRFYIIENHNGILVILP